MGLAEPRYRAVTLRRRQRSALLRAGVEDTAGADLILVADAAMAVFVAGQLNALDAGEPLHSPGEQHYPIRFQLIHDPFGLSSPVGVVYVHRSNSRMVANAPNDAIAQKIALALNHADYPMIESGSWLFPVVRPGRIVDAVPALPTTSLRPEASPGPAAQIAGITLVLVLPTLLVLGLVAVISWPYAVAAALGFAAFYVAGEVVLWRRS